MRRRQQSAPRYPTLRQLARSCPLLLLLASLGVAADEPDDRVFEQRIYESVDGVAIGRVFLSPGERERLDAIRHLPQDSGPVSASDGTLPREAEPVSPRGVGYIQADGKAARVFRDGDFVTAPRSEAQVNGLASGIILRHEADEPASAMEEGP